jgi:hypothetical protein
MNRLVWLTSSIVVRSNIAPLRLFTKSETETPLEVQAKVVGVSTDVDRSEMGAQTAATAELLGEIRSEEAINRCSHPHFRFCVLQTAALIREAHTFTHRSRVGARLDYRLECWRTSSASILPTQAKFTHTRAHTQSALTINTLAPKSLHSIPSSIALALRRIASHASITLIVRFNVFFCTLPTIVSIDCTSCKPFGPPNR